jgi:hypothetical protein
MTMGSLTDRKQDRTEPAYTIVKIRGREIRVLPDARQPGAEARNLQGTRVLQSILDAARDMKERDANRE